MKMNNRENHNVGAIDPVEDAIGELAENCPPYVAVYNLVLDRIAGDSIQDGIDLG